MSAPARKFDYASRDGFGTSIWGPMLWTLLHMISLNFPPKPTPADRQHYFTFFDSLRWVLPCGKCRQNLEANYAATGFGPHVFQSRYTLSRFVWRLHNEVNRRLDKRPVTFKACRDRYEVFRARCTGRTKQRESGCRDAVSLRRSRCILKVVPMYERDAHTGDDAIEIDPRCYG